MHPPHVSRSGPARRRRGSRRRGALVAAAVALSLPASHRVAGLSAQEPPAETPAASPEEMETKFRARIADLQESSTQSYLEALAQLKAQYSGTGRADDAAAVAREETRARRLLKNPAPQLFPLPGEAPTGAGDNDAKAASRRDALAVLRDIGLMLPLPQPGDKRFAPSTAARSGSVTVDSANGTASGFLAPGDGLKWTIAEGTVSEGTSYEIVLEYAAARRAGGGSLTVSLGDSSQGAILPGFGNWDHFRHQTVGKVEIESLPASLTIDTRRASGDDSVCRLRAVILRPSSD